jgi:ABC-type uncharacterized transport system substrate-binding protein
LNGRIERRDFLSGLVLCLSSRPTDAVAQASSRTFRIGDLHPARRDTVRGWEGELGKLGYVHGRNLVIERRDAGGQPERLAALASELVRARVDLIVATGGDAIIAAKGATVMSLSRPGGNVTGVAYAAEGTLIPKRLELLTLVVPAARRIGIPDDGSDQFRLFSGKPRRSREDSMFSSSRSTRAAGSMRRRSPT